MAPDAPEIAALSDGYGGENNAKPALAPQELDPTTAEMYEMGARREREGKGCSGSPYRPGVDSEQKAVMPQGFFRENGAVEMDAGHQPVERSGLMDGGEERGR